MSYSIREDVLSFCLGAVYTEHCVEVYKAAACLPAWRHRRQKAAERQYAVGDR